jgi:NAD(P)-dependent dehydrogenase (short-subunit alcohol dehydrogenase family)
VRNYEQLASVFDQIYNVNQRLDFVFANAGVADYNDYYAVQPGTGIPPKPDPGVVDINLDGALYTGYLAMHYFRRCPESTKGDRNLIFTSSIGGLYPCELSPVYVSTKRMSKKKGSFEYFIMIWLTKITDALIGYTRSVGKRLWAEGIRVNAICPGVVETPLLTASDEYSSIFPKEVHIEMQVVTSVVSRLLSGTEMVDGKGMRVGSDEMHSRALHISAKTFFFIEKPDIYDKEAQMTWNVMMALDR